MRALSIRILLCAASGVVIACGGNESSPEPIVYGVPTMEAPAAAVPSVEERVSFAAAPATPAAPRAFTIQLPSRGAPIGSYWSVQKLIRTGDLRVQVRSVPAAIAAADSIGKSRGGLLADSRTFKNAAGRAEAQIVIRVPSDRFAETVAALRTLGAVDGETLGTQDVTKEYADLETRIGVKERTVTRLQVLLVNRTAKLADILEAERELARVVAELEQMKGERRYIDQRAAVSTIGMTFFEKGAPNAVPNRFTAPIAAAFRRSLGTLGTSVGGVVYIVSFLVPWLVLAGGAWWVGNRPGVRRLLSRPRTAAAGPT